MSDQKRFPHSSFYGGNVHYLLDSNLTCRFNLRCYLLETKLR